MTAHTLKNKNNLEKKLFTVKRKISNKSHIFLSDPDLCQECSSNICMIICPAKVYTKNEIDGTTNIQYEDCLECGACRVACELNNIDWTNPTDGTGITYTNS